jgi:eukaryotic-like serine/threonine-protein kinase
MSKQLQMDSQLLAEYFEQIVSLERNAQSAAITALALPAEWQTKLECLLQADQTLTDVDEVIQRAAARGLTLQSLGSANQARDALIGDYRVIHELGSGGMGTVLLAERADEQYQQKVAIKLIRGFPTEEGIQRLRTERQILAQLDHPNIARLIGGGETEQGQPYLVMEYVVGLPLSAYLLHAKPDLSARLTLFEGILSAVEHAHQRLVIHRDIKPSNILVRDDGSIKLLDFGIAKLLDIDANSQRQTSTRAFTPGYSSPEQQQGALITVVSDVYSLGVLLGEILAPVLKPKSEPDLRAVIRKASEFEQSRRYASVEAMSEDLKRYRQGMPVRAAHDTVWYRARKFIVRHPTGIALGTLAMLIASGFVWQLDVQRLRAITMQEIADRERASSDLRYRFYANVFAGITAVDVDQNGMSAIALLDRAQERARADQSLSFSQRAEIFELLSGAYINAGRLVIARELAHETVKYSEAARTEISEIELASRYRELAKLMLATDQASQAWAVLEQAQALIIEPPPNAESAKLGIRILLSRVWTARAMSRADELLWVERALSYARKWLPANDQLVALAMGEHAVALERAEKFPELISLRVEIVRIMQADPKAYRRDLAANRVNLARAYRLSQQFADAKAALDAAEIDIQFEAGLATNSASLDVQLERAKLAFAAGDTSAAEALWQPVARDASSAGLDLRFSDWFFAAQVAQKLGLYAVALKRLMNAQEKAVGINQREKVAAAISTLNDEHLKLRVRQSGY